LVHELSDEVLTIEDTRRSGVQVRKRAVSAARSDA
jgi:hypothetical protein